MTVIPYRSPCNGRMVPCAITLWKLSPPSRCHISCELDLIQLALSGNTEHCFLQDNPSGRWKGSSRTNCCQKLDQTSPRDGLSSILQLPLLTELDSVCCGGQELYLCSLPATWEFGSQISATGSHCHLAYLHPTLDLEMITAWHTPGLLSSVLQSSGV